MSLADCRTSPRAWTLTSAVALVAIIILTPVVPQTVTGRTVGMRTEDGVAIAGTFHDAGRGPAPAVIFLHMLTRSRGGWDAVASWLADAGLHALTIDFRGHGGSSAGPPPPAATPISHGSSWTCGPRGRFSSRAAISSLPPRLASQTPRWAPMWLFWQPLATRRSGVSPSCRRVSITDRSGPKGLRKYGGRPALLLAGSNDPYALRSAKELAAGGGGVRQIRILENGGHGTTMLRGDHDRGRVLVDWFQRTLL